MITSTVLFVFEKRLLSPTILLTIIFIWLDDSFRKYITLVQRAIAEAL